MKKHWLAVLCCLGAALALAACGSSSTSTTAGSTGTSSNAAAASGATTSTSGASTPSAAGKTVAFIAVNPTNSYVLQAYRTAKADAKAAGIKLTEIGVAAGNPQAEVSAIQDAANQDAYDGYIIVPQNAIADMPAIKQLVATGKPVVGDSIALGPKLCTDQPQVKGMAGVALTPVCEVAQEYKQLVTMACKGLSPCNVLWLSGVTGFPSEDLIRGGVKAAVGAIPGATLTVSSPTMYDTNNARNVTADALRANPKINVVAAGAGPQIWLGAQPAIDASGIHGIRVVCDGAVQAELDALKAGKILGIAVGNGLPASDTHASMKIMEKALVDKSYRNVGVNSLKEAGLPGVFTKANESQWASFKAEWSAAG